MLTIIGPSKYTKINSNISELAQFLYFKAYGSEVGLKWPSSQINELGVFTKLEKKFLGG